MRHANSFAAIKKKKRANNKWRLEFLRKKRKILGMWNEIFFKMSIEWSTILYSSRQTGKSQYLAMVFLTLPVGDRTVVIKLDGVQLFGEDFLIDHLFTRRCPSRKGLAQLAVYYSTSMTCVSCWIQPTRHAILCRKKSGTLDILLLLLLLGGGRGLWILLFRRSETRNKKR